MNLPSVRLILDPSPPPRALDGYAKDRGDATLMAHPGWAAVQTRLAQREWKTLRARLIRLDFGEPDQIAEWLEDAGYFPVVREPHSERQELHWKSSYVTAELATWLRSYRDAIRWMMELETSAFRRAIALAWECLEDDKERVAIQMAAVSEEKKAPHLKSAVAQLMVDLRAPEGINSEIVRECLLGAALPGTFYWDREGKPAFTLHVGSPIEAIVLSVHEDLNFSARRWVSCYRCGTDFEREKSTERFCSDRCRNYCNTTERRKKLRAARGRSANSDASPPAAPVERTSEMAPAPNIPATLPNDMPNPKSVENARADEQWVGPSYELPSSDGLHAHGKPHPSGTAEQLSTGSQVNPQAILLSPAERASRVALGVLVDDGSEHEGKVKKAETVARSNVSSLDGDLLLGAPAWASFETASSDQLASVLLSLRLPSEHPREDE